MNEVFFFFVDINCEKDNKNRVLLWMIILNNKIFMFLKSFEFISYFLLKEGV